MRNHNDEQLRKALRQADPADKESLGDWSESEAGRRVLARILAEREEEPAPSSKRWTASRVALAAAAALIVIAAVVVGVIVGTRDSSGEVVESSTTSGPASTTSTAAAPQEGVERLVALAGVVWTAEAIGDTGPESPSPPGEDPVAYAERAQSLGIIGPEEADTAVASGTVSRATYALWIWRAFRDQLLQVREVDLVDLGTLSEEMQEAVTGVVDAGILDARADKRFMPDEPLTAQEEQEARGKLWKALGLSKGSDPSD